VRSYLANSHACLSAEIIFHAANMHPSPTALIAEDEPLLAQSLQRELAALWPELQTQVASDGLQAVQLALQHLPDVLFFDVRMPGQSGLEAAQEITERWPEGHALPMLVFTTAFDEYAVQAFEQAAVDYIVKPVKTARLRQCLERIRPLAHMRRARGAIESIANTRDVEADERALAGLRALLTAPVGHAQRASPARLQRIQASVGQHIVVLPISEVAYFEAADKYVRVMAGVQEPQRELLIRTPIKDLLPQLDADEFWQIHRSTLVRASLIQAVVRDESGKLSLRLKGHDAKLSVSRLYAGLFRAM
jgi:DNA-binding LytR/AlgR family response regulator